MPPPIDTLTDTLAALAKASADRPATIHADLVCRTGAGAPQWLTLCRTAFLPETNARLRADRLRQREALLNGWWQPERAGPRSPLAERMRSVVRCCAGHALDSGKLQDLLLREALANDRAVAPSLERSRSVTLPVLLVQRGVGRVAELTLWRVPVEGRQRAQATTLVPAPASQLYECSPSFVQAMDDALSAAVAHLQGPAPPWALVWDLHPIQPSDARLIEGLLLLDGASAGPALALAILVLLRERVVADLRARLLLVETARASVTAALRAPGRPGAPWRLVPVNEQGVVAKLGALLALPQAMTQAAALFVAKGQQLGNLVEAGIRPVEVEDLLALVQAVGAVTGGELTDEQVRLHALLCGDDDDIVGQALAEAPATPALGRRERAQAALQELLEAVAGQPPKNLRGYLLHRYADWARIDHGRLHVKFVNLRLTDTETGRAHAHGAIAHDGVYHSLQKALEAPVRAEGYLLVGQPGGGKSVLLQRYEMDEARRALRLIAGGQAPDTLCLWLALGEYDSVSAKPPVQWLADRWQSMYRDMPPLQELLDTYELKPRWLLDGVNEITAPNQQVRGAAARGITAALSAESGSIAAPIFSVRTLEATNLSQRRFAVHRIEVQPWDDDQMRDYITRRLPGERGQWLWQQVQDNAALKALYGRPIFLAAQCDLLEEGLERSLSGASEILSGIVWLRLRREKADVHLGGPGLLRGDDEYLIDDPQYWKTHLLDLPAEGNLIQGLDRQGELLRRAAVDAKRAGRTGVSFSVDQAASWLNAQPDERRAWIDAVRWLDLAVQDRGSRNFRFAHQLFGELFASRGLLGPEADVPRLLHELAAPALSDDLATALGKLQGAGDELALPPVVELEESFKLALQVAADPEPWVRRLMAPGPEATARNLALAGRAVAARLNSGREAGLPEALLVDLRRSLLLRGRDREVDLRQRIEAAEALGELGGDPRYRRGDSASGPFLMPLEWVTVPKGTYVIGSPEGEGSEDEHPQLKVELSAFSMAWAPVTNAEFACFIEAAGYKTEPWWPEGAARTWWRNERPREPAYWTDTRFNNGAQPVVGVSLYEAQAYALWLARCSGLPLRLALEAEWEAAARGQAGRRWSYGDAEPEPWRFNHRATRLGRTSPVGVFPDSDTPEGLADMSGNCWERTLSAYDIEGHSVDALRAVAADDAGIPRARRGGGWFIVPGGCRAACRGWDHPGDRGDNLGFRLVCAALFPCPGPSVLDS